MMDLRSTAKLGLNKHNMYKTERMKGSNAEALNDLIENVPNSSFDWGSAKGPVSPRALGPPGRQ